MSEANNESKEKQMQITLTLSDDNECTSYPWWMIVKPEQNLSKGRDGVVAIAMGMITGPFFSRESAERELNSRRYYYGPNAVVWCASGCDSREYRDAIGAANRLAEPARNLDAELDALEPRNEP